jgi:S13-like protein
VTGRHETPRPPDEQLAPRSGAVTPSRSTVQRLEALRRANEIRIGRARLKRALATGSVRITDILATPPECVRSQKVQALLLALPTYGPARVARLLAQCQISSAKTVAGLSERQRGELIGRLRG